MLAVGKRLAFRLLGSGIVTSVKHRMLSELGLITILNFHRVGPMDGSAYEPLNARLFEEILRYCQRNFQISDFAGLSTLRRSEKPIIILSFDDGYKDFIDYACPILTKYRVRVNMNLIPGCIERGVPPLNVKAQDFIGQAPFSLLCELSLPNLSIEPKHEPRAKLARKVSAYIKNRPIAEQHELAEILWRQFHRFDNFTPTPVMTKAETAEIDEAHELGAHSFDHATLSYETDEYVATDANRCAQWFVEQFGKPTKIYAFPNGEFRNSHLALVRSAGFTTLLGVGEDFSTPNSPLHLRFTFYARSFAEARFRVSGAMRFPHRPQTPSAVACGRCRSR